MNLFPEKVMSNLRCCKCYCALSTGPIYSGPDGAPVCGRCPPSPADIPNPPLEGFLSKYTFPCRYKENGCPEIMAFNEVQHEGRCQFKGCDELPFEIIDKEVLWDFKCYDCQNLLTVGPLSLTPDGKSICGRCIGRWSEVHVGEPLMRNWKLEYLMKQLHLPCKHLNLGCKRALKWEKVEDHEDFCSHRPYSCPATPFDNCETIIPAGELYTHFEKEHPALLLTSPRFKESLGQDCDIHRLVRIRDHLMVLMSKIRVQENRMWFSAAFVGDANMASTMKYVLKISNPQETLHIPFRSESMQSDVILRINEKSALPMSLDGFRVFFRQTNLPEIICNVIVEDINQVEPNWKLLKHCKRNECKAFGSEHSIKRHETETCLERIVKCKWDSCDWKSSFRNVAKHNNVCDKELILCKFNNCRREYPRCEMKSHESKCEFRIVCCKWTNCDKQYPLNEMERHESECEGTRNCRFGDCDVKCSVRIWNLHILHCKHSFSQKWMCSICLQNFLPPKLTEHVLSEHRNDICEGPNTKRKINKDEEEYVYFQYDGMLFIAFCHFYSTMDPLPRVISTTYTIDGGVRLAQETASAVRPPSTYVHSDGSVDFRLWLLSEDDLRSKYKYSLKLIHPTDSQKTITKEQEMDNRIKHISSDFVKPFIKDNYITYEFTIIKN